jgi:general secretion pathway protein G
MCRSAERGFTLFNVLAVVIFLGILAAIVVRDLGIEDLDDPVARPRSDILTIETALNLYLMDNSRYPTTEQGLTALVRRPDEANLKNWRDGGYLPEVPKDPWGNEYLYSNPGKHGQIDVYTLGRDGRPGGEGLDDTIGNWHLKD